MIMAKQGGIVSACDVDMLAVDETGKNFAQNGVAPSCYLARLFSQ